MKQSEHPEEELVEYTAGRLTGEPARAISEHIAACPECKLLVESLAAIGNRISPSTTTRWHPPVGQLAEFFYSEGQEQQASAIAAHVSVCAGCAEEIAQYAQAEAAAERFEVSRGATARIPPAAWKLIHEWETSPFARPKDSHELANDELMQKLSSLLELNPPARSREAGELRISALVGVTVIDRSGRVIGVEMFEKVEGGLKHAKQSARFDAMPVHALLEFAEGKRMVVSDRIRGDRIEIADRDAFASGPLCEDYFIVED
jgi:hypothetical protein